MSRSRGRGRKRGRDCDNGWGAWGGYMNAKISKLQNQFQSEQPDVASLHGGKTEIFKGVSIFVNGYTDPNQDELKKLMMQHGGVYHHYYGRERVTHIIASNLPNSKVMKLTDQKIVKPSWITESIAAGKLLSCEPYLLYTSRSKLQPGLSFRRTTRSTSAAVSEQESASTLENVLLDSKSPSYVPSDSVDETSTLSAEKPEVPASVKTEGAPTTGTTSMDLDELMAGFDSDSDSDLFSDCEERYNTSINRGNDSNIGESDTPVQDSMSVDCKPIPPPGTESHEKISDGPNMTAKLDASPHTNTLSKSAVEKANKSPAKAGDAGFMAEFYTNSRLHHLSTWGAEWRAYVNKLQTQPNPQFPGLEALRKRLVAGELPSQPTRGTGKPQRVIMHIDMDSFFVSVGLRNRPDLKGKPVAVTHSKGKGQGAKERAGAEFAYEQNYYKNKALQKRQGKKSKYSAEELERNPDLLRMADDEEGDEADEIASVPAPVENTFHSMSEIASCSYEARQAGVKNGMFMGQAKRLCPDMQTIPYDFEGYQEVSQILYDTVASYTHAIEAVSCDEMMVDLTDILADLGISPNDLALTLREEIKVKTKCNCSAGMGPNLLLARLATRLAKPNGQHYVSPDSVELFMKTISCRDLPGVGYTLSSRLEALGILTCAQLQQKSLAELQKEFGPKTGQSLYKFSRGQDDRPIKVEKERKSVSAEINYGIRFTHDREVTKFLEELAEEVHNRLDKIKVKGKTVTLKIKVRKKGAPKQTAKFMGHGVCDNIAKSVTLPLATDEPKVIAKECLSIVRPLKIPAEDFRGIGIQVSRLEPAVPGLAAATKGTQSILNFAFKKDDAQATKTPPPKSQSAEIINKGAIKISPPKPKSAGIINASAIKTSPKQQSAGIINESAIKTFPSKQQSSEIIGESATTEVEDVITIPEPKPRELPPLPCLPDLSSPPASQTRSRSRSSSDSRSEPVTPVRPPSMDDMLDLPSPSQVDPEVLRELPADIRQQIERALKKKKTKNDEVASQSSSQTRKSARLTRGYSQQAGCSHWKTPPHHDPEEEVGVMEISEPEEVKVIGISEPEAVKVTEISETSGHNGDSIEALPAFSQIDPSCFDALPADLQRELRQAYEKEQNVSRPATRRDAIGAHPVMQAARNSPNKTSPTKPRSSPGKAGPGSPGFKVPSTRGRGRGRPRGRGRGGRGGRGRGRDTGGRDFSPKKLEFLHSGVEQPAAKVNMASMDEKKPTASSSVTMATDTPSSAPIPSTSLPEPEVTKVNLCGAVTLTEVKVIVREWIESCLCPEPDDLYQFVQYLCDLIEDKNLEQVYLLLKYFKRCLKYANEGHSWNEKYADITVQVQSIVKAIYGSVLALI